MSSGNGESGPVDDGLTCGICGDLFASEEEAISCEEMHAMAEEEMGVFDG